MSPEKANTLYRDFPVLYPRDFYFEINDGWYHLINELSKKIMAEKPEKITVHQVKQKFGGLRFYTDKQPEPIKAVIEQAESVSFSVCEDCGAGGEPRGGSWIHTLCDACVSKRKIAKEAVRPTNAL